MLKKIRSIIVRYWVIFWGFLSIFHAGSMHVNLNLDNATDVQARGFVVSKHIVRKSGSTSSGNREYLVGVVYEITPDLDGALELYPMNHIKHGRQLVGNGIDGEKFIKLTKPITTNNNIKVGNLRYSQLKSKALHSNNLNSEIVLFYRSHRPWAVTRSLDAQRKLIPFFLIFGIILSSLWFGSILYTKQKNKLK